MFKFIIGGLIGLTGGVTSGLFGIGGGVVMVPAFVYFFGMDIKRAIGTSLLLIIPTAIVGVSRYAMNHQVDWKLALMIMAFSIIGGIIGPKIALHPQMDSAMLARIFGGFLILVGLELIIFGPLNQLSAK